MFGVYASVLTELKPMLWVACARKLKKTREKKIRVAKFDNSDNGAGGGTRTRTLVATEPKDDVAGVMSLFFKQTEPVLPRFQASISRTFS